MKSMAMARAALAVLIAAGSPGMAGAVDDAPALQVGDMAPDFTLPGSDGQTYALKEIVGKQVVVIAWFPKAFTSG